MKSLLRLRGKLLFEVRHAPLNLKLRIKATLQWICLDHVPHSEDSAEHVAGSVTQYDARKLTNFDREAPEAWAAEDFLGIIYLSLIDVQCKKVL